MNKKIITLALVALGFCGVAANAQNNATCNQACNNECKAQAPGDNNKMYQPRTFTDIAFEGILLDVNQQAAMDKINAQYKDQLDRGPKGQKGQCDKANCPKAKDCDKAKNCDKANCPKAKCDSAKNCGKDNCPMAKDGKRKNINEVRRQYASEVKNVLTPDQYVVFLENIAFNQEPGKMMKGCDKGKKKGGQEMKAQGQKTDKKNKSK